MMSGHGIGVTGVGQGDLDVAVELPPQPLLGKLGSLRKIKKAVPSSTSPELAQVCEPSSCVSADYGLNSGSTHEKWILPHIR